MCIAEDAISNRKRLYDLAIESAKDNDTDLLIWK
jgi:hypothetical protein